MNEDKQTVATEKRQAREQRLAQRRRRMTTRMLSFGGAVVAVFVLLYILFSSSLFAVKRIDVRGNTHLTDTEVKEIGGARTGMSIMRFPRADVRRRLLENTWVKEVRVGRRLPSTIVIELTERVPVAAVDDGNASFLIDESGFVIGAAGEETVVQIADLPVKTLVAGQKIEVKELSESLNVLNGLPEKIRTSVALVSAPSIDRITIYIANVEVIFGQAEKMEEKSMVLEEILAREGESVIAIDVRTPESPIVRSLNPGDDT